MKNKLSVLSLLLLILSGCTTTKTLLSTTSLVFATVQSPITLELQTIKPINGKVSISDKIRLIEESDPKRHPCFLRMKSVKNDKIKQETVKRFQLEFDNKNQCAVLAVNSTISPDNWIIAGFNDNKKFRSVTIDNPSNELSLELKKDLSDNSKIVKLIKSRIGRTFLNYDSFEDLCNEETLFFLAISGGGARATSLATHTMALLEKRYNTINSVASDNNDFKPFIDRIHVLSTVSGGSIYAYQLARIKTILDKRKANIDDRRKIFQTLELLALKSYDLGMYSGIWYSSPFNLFLGPLLTLLTDFNYLDVLSGGLNFLSNENDSTDFKRTESKSFLLDFYNHQFNPRYIKLSDISIKPRFFFNATTLETGMPFVFTQRYVNLPGRKNLTKTVRFDLKKDPLSPLPLETATTLEEINSTPENMPLAYAAMASAAFPMGIEPLELVKYGYNPIIQKIYKTSDRMHVADGGIYDNSGLTALKDLAVYLNSDSRSCRNERLVLLSINADADEYDLFYPYRTASESNGLQDIPISINFPIRTEALGLDSLNLIHFVNKRRAEQIAIDAINKIKPNGNSSEFYFFPVSLGQLSLYEKFRINDSSNLYDNLKNINTNYVIGSEDDLLLAQAAHLIVTSDQLSNEAKWGGIGCSTNPMTKLDEALVFALDRKKQLCK